MPTEMKILILVLLGAVVADAGLIATQPQAVVAAAPAYVETTPQFLAAPAPAPLLATQAVQPATVVTHAQKTIAAAPAAVSLAQPLNYATFQYVPVATPAKVLSAPIPTYISAPRTLSAGPVQNRAPSPPRDQRPPPPLPPKQPPPQLSADDGRRSRKDDDDRRNPQITIILHAAAVAPRPAGLTYLAGAAQPQVLTAAPAVVQSVPHQEVLVQQPAVLSVEPSILTSYAPQLAVLGSSAQGAEGLQQSAGPAPPPRQPEPPRRQEPPPPPPPQLSAPRPSSYGYGQQQASYGASQGPALQSSGGGGAGVRLHHDTFSRGYRLEEQRPQAAPEFSAAEAPAQPQQLSSGDAGSQQYGSGVSYSTAAQPVTNAVISGFYGFVDPLGVYQQVDYVNDHQGYRATSSSASDAGASQYAPEPAPTLSSQGMPQDQQYSGGAVASGHSGVATAKAAVYPVHAPALKYKIYQ